MNIFITLDYELFFGTNSGSVDDCIITPTQKLLEIVNPYQIKMTFFVDAGYLLALEKQKNKFANLQEDYTKITNQIISLSNEGHHIELHIHPHWEDTLYDINKGWVTKTSRYKLTDFNEEEVLDIVTRYTGVLTKTSGKPPVAYRAGGWSAQPFSPIKKALEKNNIFIDSTVYPKGYYESNHQQFDFRNVPPFKTQYTFLDDLVVENNEGNFTEIPISSYEVNPVFFWKFIGVKLRKQKKHTAFGNGQAITKEKGDVLKLLTKKSYSVVSIDGYKSSYMNKAFKSYLKNTDAHENFVLIGHPKAFTPYSLKKTKDFIKNTHNKHNYDVFK